jgi:hypothetical protein
MCSEFVDIQYDSEFYTVHFFVIQFVYMNQALVSHNRLSYPPLNRIMPVLPAPGIEPRIMQSGGQSLHGTH